MRSSRISGLLGILIVLATLSCAKHKDQAPEGGTVIMGSGGSTPIPVPAPPAPPSPPPVASNPTTPTQIAPVAPVSAAVAAPAPITAVEPRTVSTNEKVGVLRCDTFVERYVSCITHNVPADQRGPLVEDLESSIRRWQAMTSTPNGTTDAGNECLRTFDRTKQAMAPYGCTWESL